MKETEPVTWLKFSERFGRDPTQIKTARKWENKLFQTGSIVDVPRAGRPATRHVSSHAMEASIAESSMKSTRERAAELGIAWSTMQDYMKKELRMQCWRPMFVNELSDIDLNTRVAYTGAMLDTFVTLPSPEKFFSAIMRHLSQ